jgi:5'-nucleotidase
LLACSVLAVSALRPQPASALDIVLTNDDGFESSLTYAVYQALQAAGHRVLISASTSDQSGRGGAVDFLRPVAPLSATTRGGCVVPPGNPVTPGVGNLGLGAPFVVAACPSDPGVFWVNGTPVASVLHGMDVAAPLRFGKQPDLVISGPNFGNNTGLINNSSGTVNAALVAINRGIPAIAVSAAEPTSYRSFASGLQPIDREIAGVVVRLVDALDAGRQARVLPEGIGLNVNLPRFPPGSASELPFRLSNVGTASSVTPFFSADLCADPTAKLLLGATCAGASPPRLAGVSLVLNGAPFPANLSFISDDVASSEQNVVNRGEVAVSVIEGNHQPTNDSRQKVASGLQQLLEPGRTR